MTSSLPTGRRGRLLALGLTATLLLSVWFGAVEPIVAWYGDRADTIAQRTALARRMTALADSLPRAGFNCATSCCHFAKPAKIRRRRGLRTFSRQPRRGFEHVAHAPSFAVG